jgi:hypothetical protein
LNLRSGRGRCALVTAGASLRRRARAQGRELKQARNLQQDDREYGSYKQISDDTWNSNRCYMDENACCAHPWAIRCLHTVDPFSLDLG